MVLILVYVLLLILVLNNIVFLLLNNNMHHLNMLLFQLDLVRPLPLLMMLQMILPIKQLSGVVVHLTWLNRMFCNLNRFFNVALEKTHSILQQCHVIVIILSWFSTTYLQILFISLRITVSSDREQVNNVTQQIAQHFLKYPMILNYCRLRTYDWQLFSITDLWLLIISISGLMIDNYFQLQTYDC